MYMLYTYIYFYHHLVITYAVFTYIRLMIYGA